MSAARLEKKIDQAVAPVVVLARARAVFRGAHPTVQVVMLPDLVNWLQGLPARLSADAANALEKRLLQAMKFNEC